jgi:hypothetical protein
MQLNGIVFPSTCKALGWIPSTTHTHKKSILDLITEKYEDRLQA